MSPSLRRPAASANRRGSRAGRTMARAAIRVPATPGERLASGQLQAMVLAHLRAHPDLDFSPTEIANALHRPRSRGAVINACRHWVAHGHATRTHERPQRYQIAS